MKLNQSCAICDAKFAGKQELISHANEIHQKTTNPTKTSRNIAPPKRLANQLLRESKQNERKREKQLDKKYQISVQQWYFVIKIVLTYCEKKLFNCLRNTCSLEQFIQTVKGQNNFWLQNAF